MRWYTRPESSTELGDKQVAQPRCRRGASHTMRTSLVNWFEGDSVVAVPPRCRRRKLFSARRLDVPNNTRRQVVTESTNSGISSSSSSRPQNATDVAKLPLSHRTMVGVRLASSHWCGFYYSLYDHFVIIPNACCKLRPRPVLFSPPSVIREWWQYSGNNKRLMG